MITLHSTNLDSTPTMLSFESPTSLIKWRSDIAASPFLSVIIPAFNTENFICETLRSVCANAVHVDLEILVIDDGSHDGTADVSFKYLKTLPDIKFAIISTQNSGLSAARNLGVKIASGEYIAFLDSDDFVAPTGYESLTRYAAAKRCDMVFGRGVVFKNDRGLTYRFPDSHIWDDLFSGKKHGVFHAATSPRIFSVEPNANVRIWRRDFIIECDLTYPEGRHFEDIGTHLISIASAQRIGALDFDFLFYRVGRQGQITSGTSVKRFDVIANIRECLKHPKLRELKGQARAHVVYSILRMVRWCASEVQTDYKSLFEQEEKKLYSEISQDWWKSHKKIYQKNLDSTSKCNFL